MCFCTKTTKDKYGIINLDARCGSQYFVTFAFDFNSYEYVYPMFHKSKALEMFKDFKDELKTN